MGVLTLILLASSCTAQIEGNPTTFDSLSCTDAIDHLSEIPDGFVEVSGVLALATSRPWTIGDRTRVDGEVFHFAKSGLLVRSLESSVISSEVSSSVLIEWGESMREPVHEIRVPACEGEDEWLAFAGGAWVAEASCVNMSVNVGGRVESVAVPIGDSCAE